MLNYSVDEIMGTVRGVWGHTVPDDVVIFLADLFQISHDGVLDLVYEDED